MSPDTKKKLLYGGAIIGAGVILFATVGKKSDTEEAAPTQGIDPAMLASLLMGGAGGLGGGTGGSGAIPGFPDAGIIVPEFDTGEDQTSMLGDMMRYFSDNSLFAALGLGSGESLVRTSEGVSRIPAPKQRSAAEIRSFIDAQAASGAPINSASIVAWSNQYGVPLEQIGAAYGKTPQQSVDWLKANDPSKPRQQNTVSSQFSFSDMVGPPSPAGTPAAPSASINWQSFPDFVGPSSPAGTPKAPTAGLSWK